MTPEERSVWAQRIAHDIAHNDHSYKKHCESLELAQANGKPLTREQYQELIYKSLMDPRAQGRTVGTGGNEKLMLYSHETGMVICINPRNTQDGNTAYPLSSDPRYNQGSRLQQIPEGDRLAHAEANRSVRNGIIYNHGQGFPPRAMDVFRAQIEATDRLGQPLGRNDRGEPVKPIKGDGGPFDAWISRRENAARVDRTARPHDPETGHHAPGHAGRLGRAAGVVGVVIAAAAAAGEAAAAEGRTPGLGDYGRAAWNNTAAGAATQNRKMEAIMRIIDCMDPTMGLTSGALRDAVRGAGADVDPGMLSNCEKMNAEQARRFRHDANLLAINARDQWAILQEAGLTNIRDAKGARIDVGAILRDPTQREAFITTLKKSYESEQDPAQKEKLRLMISGANRYTELQRYREIVIADARATMENPNGKPGAPLPSSPMAPLAANGLKSFGSELAITRASNFVDQPLTNELTRAEKIEIGTLQTSQLLDPSTFVLTTRIGKPDPEAESPDIEKPKSATKQTPVFDSSNY